AQGTDRHAVAEMLAGHRRVGHQVAFSVDDAAVETVQPGIDAGEHAGRDKVFEGAAKGKALIAAVGDRSAATGVQNSDAETAAVFRFERRKPLVWRRLGHCRAAADQRRRCERNRHKGAPRNHAASYAVLAAALPSAAWAAARRAIGTRNGEQDT